MSIYVVAQFQRVLPRCQERVWITSRCASSKMKRGKVVLSLGISTWVESLEFGCVHCWVNGRRYCKSSTFVSAAVGVCYQVGRVNLLSRTVVGRVKHKNHGIAEQHGKDSRFPEGNDAWRHHDMTCFNLYWDEHCCLASCVIVSTAIWLSVWRCPANVC